MRQNEYDYTKIHGFPEIRIRVELLAARLREMGADPHASVLEVALGSGDITKLLAEYFDALTCVDIEADHLAQVASYIAGYPDLRVPSTILGAAETVDLPTASFDHIVLFGLLEHCPDAGVALENLRLALKPNGRMHILVNNANSIHRWLGVELGMIRSVEEISESDIGFGHYRVYTPQTLRIDIERSGLRIDYTDLHYMKPLPTPLFNNLSMDLHRAFCELGRRFPEFSSYIYVEAVVS